MAFFSRLGTKACKFQFDLIVERAVLGAPIQQALLFKLIRGDKTLKTNPTNPATANSSTYNFPTNHQPLTVVATLYKDKKTEKYQKKDAKFIAIAVNPKNSAEKELGKFDFDLAEFLNEKTSTKQYKLNNDKKSVITVRVRTKELAASALSPASENSQNSTADRAVENSESQDLNDFVAKKGEKGKATNAASKATVSAAAAKKASKTAEPEESSEEEEEDENSSDKEESEESEESDKKIQSKKVTTARINGKAAAKAAAKAVITAKQSAAATAKAKTSAKTQNSSEEEDESGGSEESAEDLEESDGSQQKLQKKSVPPLGKTEKTSAKSAVAAKKEESSEEDAEESEEEEEASEAEESEEEETPAPKQKASENKSSTTATATAPAASTAVAAMNNDKKQQPTANETKKAATTADESDEQEEEEEEDEEEASNSESDEPAKPNIHLELASPPPQAFKDDPHETFSINMHLHDHSGDSPQDNKAKVTIQSSNQEESDEPEESEESEASNSEENEENSSENSVDRIFKTRRVSFGPTSDKFSPPPAGQPARPVLKGSNKLNNPNNDAVSKPAAASAATTTNNSAQTNNSNNAANFTNSTIEISKSQAPPAASVTSPDALSVILSPSEHAKIFDCTLAQAYALNSKIAQSSAVDIPFILEAAVAALERTSAGFAVQNLFKQDCKAAELNKIKAQLQQGDYNLPTSVDPHLYTNLIKMWLNSLTDSVIPPEIVQNCLNIGQFELEKLDLDNATSEQEEIEEKSEVRAALSAIMSEMPPLNRRVLLRIIRVIRKIIQPSNSQRSNMNLQSLSVIFAPILLRYKGISSKKSSYEQFQDAQHSVRFIQHLFRYAYLLARNAKDPTAASPQEKLARRLSLEYSGPIIASSATAATNLAAVETGLPKKSPYDPLNEEADFSSLISPGKAKKETFSKAAPAEQQLPRGGPTAEIRAKSPDSTHSTSPDGSEPAVGVVNKPAKSPVTSKAAAKAESSEEEEDSEVEESAEEAAESSEEEEENSKKPASKPANTARFVLFFAGILGFS
jgi:hypothetical protein